MNRYCIEANSQYQTLLPPVDCMNLRINCQCVIVMCGECPRVPGAGVLRHPVGTQTAETETTGQCGVSPLQLVNIQAAREICRQCAGEMSSTFTNSFKHLMNVLKLREKMSCLGLGWLLGIQSCMNEELKFIL